MRPFENPVPDYVRRAIIHAAPFSVEQLKAIFQTAIDRLKNQQNYVILDDMFSDVVIVGDTHGDITSTSRVVNAFLESKAGSLAFLGDYVDRGNHSLLNLVTVVGLSNAFPRRVLLLRGNHEDININGRYGFKSEIKSLFPDATEQNKVLDLVSDLYEYLPLAAMTPAGSILMHGGIAEGLSDATGLNEIPKPHAKLGTIPDVQERTRLYDIFNDTRWSDPKEDQLARFVRDPSRPTFNEVALAEFLQASNAARLIRSHESARKGFQALFNNKLLHVFSTEPYFGSVPRAHVIHEKETGKVMLCDLDLALVDKIA
jgi:hypothetical protein